MDLYDFEKMFLVVVVVIVIVVRVIMRMILRETVLGPTGGRVSTR